MRGTGEEDWAKEAMATMDWDSAVQSEMNLKKKNTEIVNLTAELSLERRVYCIERFYKEKE